MDGQFCQQEPFWIYLKEKASSNVAFITTRMLEDRNTRKGSFQLHATFPASQARIGRQLGSSTGSYMACQHNLESRRCRPPLADGGWAKVPLEAAQATSWIRELLEPESYCPVGIFGHAFLEGNDA